VFDFGAVGDGVHNDTDAIQATLDACRKFGGCTVWLPDNGTFLCYPISISSDNTELKIDGEVCFLPKHHCCLGSYAKPSKKRLCFLLSKMPKIIGTKMPMATDLGW